MALPERKNYHPDAGICIEWYVKEETESGSCKRGWKNAPLFNTPVTKKGLRLPLDVLISREWPSEPHFLAALNPHPFDSRIKFNPDTHTYFVAYSISDSYPSEFNLSASTWAKQQFPGFQADIVLAKMQAKETWNTSHNKYFGMCPEQIKAKWESDRNRDSRQGTFYHLLLENHCNRSFDLSDYDHLLPIQQYLHWRKTFFDVYYEEFRTEMRLYSSPEERIVGTADLFAIRKDHGTPEETGGVLTITIFDWKNTKELKTENRWERGYKDKPCAGLDNCNWSTYCIQQNIYAWLAETWYKEWEWRGKKYTSLKVERLALVIIHDRNPKNEAIMKWVPNFRHIIDNMVTERRAELRNMIEQYNAKKQQGTVAMEATSTTNII